MPFINIDVTGTLNEKQKDALINMLRMLENVDDGAFRRDYVGFNLQDSLKGDNLAAKSFSKELTEKEYLWVKKALFKYWRQLPITLFNIVYGKGAWERVQNKQSLKARQASLWAASDNAPDYSYDEENDNDIPF
jgi:hypothetical protein